jgi:hypothetical protein
MLDRINTFAYKKFPARELEIAFRAVAFPGQDNSPVTYAKSDR